MSYPSRPIRVVLGLLSIAPLVIVITVFGSVLASAAGAQAAGPLNPNSDAGFFLFLALCVGLGLCSMALLAYYVVFIFRSERVKPEHKALWAIVLFMGNAIGFPIFWFIYFWREAETLLGGRH